MASLVILVRNDVINSGCGDHTLTATLTMAATKIIYGTAWKKERTTALVVSAVLHGFRAIDTACQPKHYREDLVGVALEILYGEHSIKREDLFIQTKYTPISGQDQSQPLPYDPTTDIPTQVQTSVQTSLKNLRTTYIDSLLLHSPLRKLEDTLSAWRTLISLQDTGVIRKIGVSNTYDVAVLAALEHQGGRRPDVIQNRWYEGNGWDNEVRIRGLQLMTYVYQVLLDALGLAKSPAASCYSVLQSGRTRQSMYQDEKASRHRRRRH